MKRLHARGLLKTIAFDLQKQLDENVKTKIIFDVLMKRLKRIQENTYQKIDWS
jgi:hypothetical protein